MLIHKLDESYELKLHKLLFTENLVARVSLLYLTWSLEERPWLRLATRPPRIWWQKILMCVRGG